jgi:hypothetical protein
MHVPPAILRPGDIARASGRMTSDNGRIVILLGDAPMHRPSPPPAHNPTVVELQLSAASANGGGKRLSDSATLSITAVGTWDGQTLHPSSIRHEVEQAPDSHTEATRPNSRYEQLPEPALSTSPEVSEALSDLFSEGSLVSFWVGEGKAWATSTNNAAVAETLQPLYGSQLQIVDSRWSAAEVSAARKRLTDISPEMQSAFGDSHGPDHQVSLWTTVKYFSPHIAETLWSIAPGLIDVRPLIQKTSL